jgi:hypothetical protein
MAHATTVVSTFFRFNAWKQRTRPPLTKDEQGTVTALPTSDDVDNDDDHINGDDRLPERMKDPAGQFPQQRTDPFQLSHPLLVAAFPELRTISATLRHFTQGLVDEVLTARHAFAIPTPRQRYVDPIERVQYKTNGCIPYCSFNGPPPIS